MGNGGEEKPVRESAGGGGGEEIGCSLFRKEKSRQSGLITCPMPALARFRLDKREGAGLGEKKQRINAVKDTWNLESIAFLPILGRGQNSPKWGASLIHLFAPAIPNDF